MARDLAWRVAAVTAASLAAVLAAPAWLSTPLAAVAAVAAIQAVLRLRHRDWPETAAIGTAGALIALVLVGVVLQLFPAGLTRTGWAVGVNVVELAAVLWAATRTRARASGPRVDPRTLRTAGWYVGAAALAAVAMVISVHSADVTNRPPQQLHQTERDAR